MGFGARSLNEARAFLAQAGYERTQVAALRKEGGDLRLETLVSLFIDGEPLEAAEAEYLIGPGLTALLDAGLLREDGSAIRRAVLLVPHEGVLIASDDPDYDGADYVTGVQRLAHMNALLTPRTRVQNAADIGTGCGILALLAARHAERVVATDINDRAVRFGELNAGLNGLDNIELREGSFFEPLADETFDLIVSNPPFLVSPATEYIFRDSGRGDALSEEIVRGLSAQLTQHGHAVVMISWVANDESDIKRPLSWVADDCGAALVVTEVKDAATDAEAWIRAAGSGSPEAELERWQAWYREREIARLAYGVIVVRRGVNGRFAVRVAPDDLGPKRDEILRLLESAP